MFSNSAKRGVVGVSLAGMLFLLSLFPSNNVSAVQLFTGEGGQKQAETSLEFGGAAGFAKEGTNEEGLISLVGTLINSLLSLLGVVFLGLIIYGGFIWMNAQGNEEDVKKAKSIITQATMGLIVVLGAYVISRFVISALTEKTLKKTTDALLLLFV